MSTDTLKVTLRKSIRQAYKNIFGQKIPMEIERQCLEYMVKDEEEKPLEESTN